MISRRSRVGDSGYGLGIWHRRYEVATADGPRRVYAVMLAGNGGQKVYVDPSLDLIVVSVHALLAGEAEVPALWTPNR